MKPAWPNAPFAPEIRQKRLGNAKISRIRHVDPGAASALPLEKVVFSFGTEEKWV